MVKSHRDTNAKGNGHWVMDQIRKRIAEIDSMHGEQGRMAGSRGETMPSAESHVDCVGRVSTV